MACEKVTVIMNSYKENPKFLREAIKSYLNQVNVNLDFILSTVDGDSSIKIAKEMSPKIRICTLEKPGIYPQLNNALKYIEGDWMTYASSNDVALSNKLALETRLCIKYNRKVCYSSFHHARSNLKIYHTQRSRVYKYEDHRGNGGNFVSDCAMIHKSMIDKYGPFKLEFGNHAYHDFWLRIAEGEGEKAFVYNSKPTWIYRILPTSSHIKRLKNPALKKANKNLQQKMLKAHR